MKSLRPIALPFILLSLQTVCTGSLVWRTSEQVVDCPIGQEHLTAVYSFINTGNEPVRITDIRHSCGCTTSGLEKEVIEPGGEGTLVVSMDTKGLKGEQAKTVSVYTSENPGTPHILYLYTDIPERFKITPAILAWKFRGEKEVRRASVRAHRDIGFSPDQIMVKVNDRDNVGIPFEAALRKGSGPLDVVIEVLPGSLEKMGHNYLEIYYVKAGEAEKISDIYLLVN